VKRGEIWTVSGGPGYADKPRPVVIIQGDRYDATASMMVDKITTVPKTRLGYRLGVLDAEDVTRLNRAIVVFLGVAG